MDNFGDRMKAYEMLATEARFMPLLPVYARIDGRCFSRFTRGMQRPFDKALSDAMVELTGRLVDETNARIGYTQSDEISLTWLQDDYKSEMLFGGKVQKWCSVLASYSAAIFGQLCAEDEHLRPFAAHNPPHFDCRVFQLPNQVEGANVFLWREQDATKNAISMAARSMCSHKELQGKSGPEMQEMMFQKGTNFDQYPAFFKRGTFVRRIVEDRHLTESERRSIPAEYRPSEFEKVKRSRIVSLEMPRFASVLNRTDVIYRGADPITEPVA